MHPSNVTCQINLIFIIILAFNSIQVNSLSERYYHYSRLHTFKLSLVTKGKIIL